ncbi:MAG: secondary thiamine-phosphate synthase enzyme YjbQ [Candidatus Paceibacterota bacterium]
MTKFQVSTKGFNDIINITSQVKEAVDSSDVEEGMVLVFVAHSTAAVTTIEHERGVLKDLKEAVERLAPRDNNYHHNKTAGDGNGDAHVKAALLKPSLVLPIEDGKLDLGTWQQPILIDFDNRPREREVIIRIMKK